MHKVRVLFTGGSLNQTTQMVEIADALPPGRFDLWFTCAYTDGLLGWCSRRGLLEWTILGERLSSRSLELLRDRGAQVDDGGRRSGYDLVFISQDIVVPRNIRGARVVLVQEGMTDPENWAYWMYRRFPFLPRWIASTATMGLSDAYDRFCVASPGYRDFFIAKGVRPEKLVVTGIPNFDDCERYRHNRFPYRGYVLVCSSDSRETGKLHDRGSFLRRSIAIAAGRPLIFKLHPNERVERAVREIHDLAPSALVFSEGCAEEMVANCDVLIVEYSTLAYVGLILGKEVHAWFDLSFLRRMLPEQHGRAAQRIARVACQLVGVSWPESVRTWSPARLRGVAR